VHGIPNFRKNTNIVAIHGKLFTFACMLYSFAGKTGVKPPENGMGFGNRKVVSCKAVTEHKCSKQIRQINK